jgi:hypothetical protein
VVKARAQDLFPPRQFASAREVEKGVEGMRKGKAEAEDTATMERPANGLPEDLRDHARLMCDIIAIAFQANKTRVASLIISRGLSAINYPFLDGKEGHHCTSHNDNSDGYERISRFPRRAVRLPSREAGPHTGRQRHGSRQRLPDVPVQHVIGRKHDNFRLPLLLAGSLVACRSEFVSADAAKRV